MRVLSFIFAFVAVLGLVAALPAPDLGTTASSVSPTDAFKNATIVFTPIQQKLTGFCNGDKPDATAVVAVIEAAAEVIVYLTAQLNACINLNVAVEVDAVVGVVLEFLAVVIVSVQAILNLVVLLIADVSVLVAAVKIFLNAILALVAQITVIVNAQVVVAVIAVVKAVVAAVVAVCVKLGVDLVL